MQWCRYRNMSRFNARNCRQNQCSDVTIMSVFNAVMSLENRLCFQCRNYWFSCKDYSEFLNLCRQESLQIDILFWETSFWHYCSLFVSAVFHKVLSIWFVVSVLCSFKRVLWRWVCLVLLRQVWRSFVKQKWNMLTCPADTAVLYFCNQSPLHIFTAVLISKATRQMSCSAYVCLRF